jgi:putative phosphoribosyl transferase
MRVAEPISLSGAGERHAQVAVPGRGFVDEGGFSRAVRIPVGDVSLSADWVMPAEAAGIVLFAHGSGSSRHSVRNQAVAKVLQQHGMGTLLLDLLTLGEEQIDLITGELRLDMGLLAARLAGATHWIQSRKEALDLPLGYFGASTGGGAALVAAVASEGRVAAVVSRGGRPDLAGEVLTLVSAPTLLIVGGNDHLVLNLNWKAFARLHCPKSLAVIPGAGHLFEETGAMEQVSALASRWFLKYFQSASSCSIRGTERGGAS